MVNFKKVERLAILELMLHMSLEDGPAIDLIESLMKTMAVPSLDDFPASVLAGMLTKMKQYAMRNICRPRLELVGALRGKFFVPGTDSSGKNNLLWNWQQHCQAYTGGQQIKAANHCIHPDNSQPTLT